jgi:hypothetical protein
MLGLFLSFLLRRLPRERALAGSFNILQQLHGRQFGSAENSGNPGASKAYELVRHTPWSMLQRNRAIRACMGALSSPRLARHAATPNPVRSGADDCVPVRAQTGFLTTDWLRACADGGRFGQNFAAYAD